MKKLGQVNYEAFWADTPEGMAPWEDLDADTQRAWQQGAEAAVRVLVELDTSGMPNGDPNCHLCHGQGAFRIRHGLPPGNRNWHLDHCPICRPWAWGKT